jgi:outer membrane protein TolC
MKRWILVVAVMLAGCQAYSPAPLELEEHAAEVSKRDPAEVSAYARELAKRRGETVKYDAADGLSLVEAEVVALFFNPQLRAIRAKAGVAAAGAAEAGRWEDPELSIDGERIIESVEHPWVLGGMIGLTLPLSGRLALEKNAAKSEADVEQARVLAEERRVVGELRESWIEWSAGVERLALLSAHLEQVDALVEQSRKLREAGEISPLDEGVFRIERARQQARRISLEAEVRAARVELLAKMGLAADAKVMIHPALSAEMKTGYDPVSHPRVMLAKAEMKTGYDPVSHPRVMLARAEYELAERNLELEIRRQYPDLKLGGGYGEDEGTHRVLFGVSVPLPIFNANRKAIAQARAHRDAVAANARAALEELSADVAIARARMEAAQARIGIVEKELAPLADRQIEDAKKLGRLGDATTLILLDALKTSREAKEDVLDARAQAAKAVAKLRTLTEK